MLIPKSKKMRKFKRIPLTKEVQELYKMSRQHVDFTFSHIEDGYAIYLIENNETSEAKCDSRRKLPSN
ncbi:hypothetical protein BMR07_04740 [Methylococcaceae bacterium CS1]|nr:hypothetical protein BMR11_02515 [Methylococcaceae bacterium CS5]TXL07435.1 hypothetical protein BMR07_04740 [Methylococcaceae bacterium CS1]